jgi:hypothetical protein
MFTCCSCQNGVIILRGLALHGEKKLDDSSLLNVEMARVA